MKVLRLPWLAACVMMVAGAMVGRADGDAGGRIEVASVGFAGTYRTGAWTPVTVRLPGPLASRDDEVFLWAEDPDGAFVRSPPARLLSASDGRGVATATVRIGRPTGRVRVEVDGVIDPELVELPRPLPSDARILLVLGELPGIRRVCRLLEGEGDRRPQPVEISDPSSLGRAPLDFDAADCVLVCGSAIASGGEAWPEDVATAIDGWVRRGGALVLLAGSTAARIAETGGVAAEWLPGRFEKLVPLRRTAAIETFARSSRPLEASASRPIQVPLFGSLDERSDAVIDAFEGNAPGDMPLVVRRAHGFGTITWTALDLDAPPMRNWQGTDTLLVQLLQKSFGSTIRSGDSQPDWKTSSIDLAGQLRRAIDTYPGVAPVPFELIAALAAMHVFALYPMSWMVLRFLKRRTGREPVFAAWISLPLVVGIFSLVCWAVGNRFHPDAWRSNQRGCLDLDAGDGSVRAFSFIGTWSPRNASLDRGAGPAEAVPATASAVEVSWFAPAGKGVGGTDAASTHALLAAADYAYRESLAALQDVPIAAASSRLFEARWHGHWRSSPDHASPENARPIVGRLERDAQGTLRGSIQSSLPFGLEHCVLVHAGWLYDVGDLAPGGTFDPSAGRGPRSLAGSLTRRAANRERDVAVRYDPASRDIGRILEVAGLHGAAGGTSYTTIDAGRLGSIDLSPLLAVHRAILIGQGPTATTWTGDPRQPTGEKQPVRQGTGQDGDLWRIVIPVGRDLGPPTSRGDER